MAGFSHQPAAARLTVGASRVSCPSAPGLELSGFVDRAHTSTGTHDPVWARALVVGHDNGATHRSAVVTVDVVGLDVSDARMLRHQIEDATGISRDAVIIVATHTHSAPAAMPLRAPMGVVDGSFWSALCAAIVSSVVEADRTQVAATLRMGIGTEPTVARNRRIPGGPIDMAVPVVRADVVGGELLALLFSYACHPVTLGPDNTEVSADYPGFAIRAVEAVFDDSVALFATGCAGQLNTGHLERSFGEARRLGRAVAGAAIQCAAQIGPPAGRPVAMAPDAAATPPTAWCTVQVGLPKVQSAGDDLDGHDHAKIVEVDVTALRWGSIVVVGLPGEPFMEIGQQIRSSCGIPGVVVLGYANGCPGYIPDVSAYAAGGYEVCDAHRFYGESAAFAPEAAGRLVAAALHAIKQVTTFEHENEKISTSDLKVGPIRSSISS